MSLYAEYIKERLDDNIIEEEYGFATYRYLNDKKTVYIVDIYVSNDCRKLGFAAEMADKIVEIAKKEGATELLGTVSPASKNATQSLKVLLAYEMSLVSANENMILFRKDL